jgi:hypothetical protein
VGDQGSDHLKLIAILSIKIDRMNILKFGRKGDLCNDPSCLRLNFPRALISNKFAYFWMGTNKVLLEDLGDGVFEGQGVIVRCMSGRRTWRARITLPDLGRADFIFDVVY